MKVATRRLIGRSELVDFPELGLFNVPSKVDTGAYTSSMHCVQIYESQEAGRKLLHFRPLNESWATEPGREVVVSDYTRRKIINSFGHYEMRFVIRTVIVLGGKSVKTEISLSDRRKLRYPVLLGRRLLAKGFIIDVCRKNTAHKSLKVKIDQPEKPKKKSK